MVFLITVGLWWHSESSAPAAEMPAAAHQCAGPRRPRQGQAHGRRPGGELSRIWIGQWPCGAGRTHACPQSCCCQRRQVGWGPELPLPAGHRRATALELLPSDPHGSLGHSLSVWDLPAGEPYAHCAPHAHTHGTARTCTLGTAAVDRVSHQAEGSVARSVPMRHRITNRLMLFLHKCPLHPSNEICDYVKAT